MRLPAVIEIERRFLVAQSPDDLPTGDEIVQAYITTEPVAVRVRRRNERFTLTVKAGGGVERVEVERPISEAEFAALEPFARALRIEKTRHLISLDDGRIAEFDVFGGQLAGHRLVEVEFPDRETAAQFAPPPWFGAEVTDDLRFTNSSLAANGWPT